MTIWISVTQAHLDRGVRGSPSECPLALAVRDAGLRQVSVRTPHVTARSCGQWRHQGTLPQDALWFAWQFDAGMPVRPFDVELRLFTTDERDLYCLGPRFY